MGWKNKEYLGIRDLVNPVDPVKKIIMPNYELIAHTADIGIRVKGSDLKEIFINAGSALFDILTDPEKVARSETMEIIVTADRVDDLMNFWLSELLQQFTVHQKLMAGLEVIAVSENKITARLSGESYDPKKHPIKTEIKAVTFHGLFVEKKNDTWQAQIIFDV